KLIEWESGPDNEWEPGEPRIPIPIDASEPEFERIKVVVDPSDKPYLHTRSKEKDALKCNIVRFNGKNGMLVTNSRFSKLQISRLPRRMENRSDRSVVDGPKEGEVDEYLQQFERGDADIMP